MSGSNEVRKRTEQATTRSLSNASTGSATFTENNSWKPIDHFRLVLRVLDLITKCPEVLGSIPSAMVLLAKKCDAT